MREISGIPDIGELVLSQKVTIRELIPLRRSRSGEQFREWFHENCREAPVRTSKEYMMLLKEIVGAKSTTGRIIRFVVTRQ